MKPVDLVNINIGTENTHLFSHGNIYPICSLPFGMNYFSIQTSDECISRFYSPNDSVFQGFRLTHQPSPWINDFGHIRFMAGLEKMPIDISHYDNAASILKPFELSIHIKDSNIDFSLVPSTRGAIIEISSRSNSNVSFSILPYEHSEFKVKNKVVTGYTDAKSTLPFKKLREYFYFAFSKKEKSVEELQNGGLLISFNSSKITIKMATSFISLKQAKLNFDNEIRDETFESLKKNAYELWDEKLGSILVECKDINRLKTFYSCFYRALLFPTTFYELNESGEPLHYNADLSKVFKGTFFTNNGFWDTYKTEYPLLTILFPTLVRDIIEGFVNYSEETGWLPKWICPGEIGMMPGALIEAVIADAAVKGIIKGELLERAYVLLKKNAFQCYGRDWLHGRRFLDDYINFGYIPNDHHECINNTLDCAYGDYCISQVAKLLNDNDVYTILLNRSNNYKNLFDKEVGFMRGKDRSGSFRKTFSAIEWGGDNCEGSYWQNSFAVYHDIEGLANLYGGEKEFEHKLDELFSTKPEFEVGFYKQVIHEMNEMAACDFGQCAISNQPSFHIPWLYSMIGNKKKTIYWVKKIVDEAFNYTEKGFPGDEDNGSMSSWYIFACLGFYPVCPGKDEFAVSEQLFDSIKINGVLLKKQPNKNVISTKDLF